MEAVHVARGASRHGVRVPARSLFRFAKLTFAAGLALLGLLCLLSSATRGGIGASQGLFLGEEGGSTGAGALSSSSQPPPRKQRRLSGGCERRRLSSVLAAGGDPTGWEATSDTGIDVSRRMTHEEDHSDHDTTLQEIVSFLAVCFVVCSALEHINTMIPFEWRVPSSVAMCLAGMVVCLVALKVIAPLQDDGKANDFRLLVKGIKEVSQIDAHAVFYIFLPPLLYESSSSMSWHVLSKVLPSASLLAIPGVLVNVFMTGGLVKLTIEPSIMTWPAALLLGSILSATDPVAVVASLTTLGAPKKLSSLIEGESLLNDGSAVVFFFVFLDLVAPSAPDHMKQCKGGYDTGCAILFFFRLALGGVVLGAFISWLTALWLASVRKHVVPTLEVAVVTTSVYCTFIVAEALHVSGVLAVVTLGAATAAKVHAQMSHEGRHQHHAWFQQFGYMCNQAIFFIAGVVMYRFMFEDVCNMGGRWSSWLELMLLYVFIHVTRTLVILVFLPFLKSWGYGITAKEAAMLIFGGLRGAVGLSMGLMVEAHSYVDREIASIIAFHTSGIVLLTLLINGSLVDEVYNKLNLYPVNAWRRTRVRKQLHDLEQRSKNAIKQQLSSWFYKGIDLETLNKCIPDFRNCDFDQAGVPREGKDIHPVLDILQELETQSEQKASLHVASMRPGDDAEPFSVRWSERKFKANKESTGSRIWGINTSTYENRGTTFKPMGKDRMVRVRECGERVLEYAGTKDESTKGCTGHYISVKSLADLGKDSFSVTMQQTGGIVVGLFMDINGAIQRMDTIASPKARSSSRPRNLDLGASLNTVGFDCSTGRLKHSSSEEVSEQVAPIDFLPRGSTIQVHAMSDEDFDIVVEFTEMVTQTALGRIHFTDCGLDNLYPAVEFVPGVACCEDITVASQPLGDASALLQRMITNKKFRSLSQEHISTTAHLEKFTLAPQADGAPPKVLLSFEPQVASVSESFSEIFNRIFSSIQWQYNHLHDSDELDSSNLLRLTESVMSAMDLANNERNAKRVTDFIHERQPRSRRTLSAFVRHQTTVVAGKLGLGNSRKHDDRATQLEAAPSSTMREELQLEPLMLELLYVERFVSRGSMWEDWRWRQMQLFRRFRYRRFLERVEILWAFCHAHETAIRQLSPMRDMFPHLFQRMLHLVGEARKDLLILQDMNQVLYHFAKHALALRHIMTQKLKTIEHAVRDGRIDSKDTDVLVLTLRERIQQVEHYQARLPSGRLDAVARQIGRASHRMTHMGASLQRSTSRLSKIDDPEGGGGGGAVGHIGSLRSNDATGLSSIITPTGCVPPNFMGFNRASTKGSSEFTSACNSHGRGGTFATKESCYPTAEQICGRPQSWSSSPAVHHQQSTNSSRGTGGGVLHEGSIGEVPGSVAEAH